MELTLTVSGLLLSLVALGMALRLQVRGLPDTRVREAFKLLEDDVDKALEKVDSALGRMARLKRVDRADVAVGVPPLPAPTPASAAPRDQAIAEAEAKRDYDALQRLLQ